MCVADGRVYVGSRDAADRQDVCTAHDVATGEALWTFATDAPLDLDYGNAPRATPAYADGLLVVLGAGGRLRALDAATGLEFWSVDLAERYGVETPTWGFGNSPLVIGDSVFVQVGGPVRAAAFDLTTGEEVWANEGAGLPHASLTPLPGEALRLAGVDRDGHFVLDAASGETLWTHRPEYFEEFGVPSPVVLPGAVAFTGENTGVLRFPLLAGMPAPRTSAANDLLTPDSHTPVFAGGVLLVAYEGLSGLDPATLAANWTIAADDVRAYASVLAADDRALVTTEAGDVLLIAFGPGKAEVIDRMRLTDKPSRVLSHPAVAGDRLLFRVGAELRCHRLPRD